MNGIDLFNKFYGRLRISITNCCQLKCCFCHQEGINDYLKPVFIDLFFFKNLVTAFQDFNGKEINITGGEPTLHPQIIKIIEITSNSSSNISLSTNGINLNIIQSQIHKLDQIKLSLHEIDNYSGKKMLGKEFDFYKIEKNLLNALNKGAKLVINFVHTKTNTNSFRRIIEKVIIWDLDLLVIDLINTRYELDINKIGKVDINYTESIIEEYAKWEGYIRDKTGCIMKVFRSANGRKWMIKNISYGRLFTYMCKECEYRRFCGEGVFALRIDSTGCFKPCLLRNDLDTKINPLTSDIKIIKNQLLKNTNLMFPNNEFEIE